MEWFPVRVGVVWWWGYKREGVSVGRPSCAKEHSSWRSNTICESRNSRQLRVEGTQYPHKQAVLERLGGVLQGLCKTADLRGFGRWYEPAKQQGSCESDGRCVAVVARHGSVILGRDSENLGGKDRDLRV